MKEQKAEKSRPRGFDNDDGEGGNGKAHGGRSSSLQELEMKATANYIERSRMLAFQFEE